MEISEKLKQCRMNKSLTQAQVAETLHVSRKTISGWENGRSYPDVNSFVKLSDLYGVSLDLLLRDNRVLSYYKEQNEKSLQIHKVAKRAYILNFILWLLSYVEFFRIAGIHFLLIPALLAINITIFMSYYDNWKKMRKHQYSIKVILSFILIFFVHVILNFFNDSYIYSLANNDISSVGDFMMGRFTLILLMDLSLLIVIFGRDALKKSESLGYY
ncbi:Transcriptional regulator, XRE family [Pediococcus damnosus]|uniref:Transcriptional regulator, XRE family n=1 Tax=Pediococcus damnosus TaxID=51663 RepID=A0A0R2HKY1_9LACO|nr:helix-turn-helix transcriptional regulator [Pediococcus damnosus]AMV63105.1 Transcriptional regulator, XRE family [Pediococcus damnosus]AMV67003.1 Transcriptional regulator, XRE family [Pediococcus damnosus]KJU74451.1 transcriptional regulator [Pediococcus damnosus LMG 28219]KRN53647.1 transcriptional regulator [Pediococcus damnosus]PIO85308.1 transcriptional regulator [Pediococcus damnosus]